MEEVIKEIEETELLEQTDEMEAPKRDEDFGLYNDEGVVVKEEE